MPVFLEVASIINSYSQEGTLNAGATLSSDLPNAQNIGAKARYKDYWYWIDSRNFNSKGLFTFAMLLFTLAETGSLASVPVVTIPAG
jgi:hypothetical protein